MRNLKNIKFLKHGFTLAELLIAILIIGVISAIFAVAVPKLKPDVNKIKYLKTYDALSEAVNALLENETLYPTTGVNNVYKDNPLANITINGGINNNKLTSLIANAFVGENNNINNWGDYQNFNAVKSVINTVNNGKSAGLPAINFKTKNGVEFYALSNVSNDMMVETDFYFDVNGANKGNNCIYDAESCQDPDIFMVSVDNTGKLVPSDPKGKQYINTRHNWLRKRGEVLNANLSNCPDGQDLDENGICKNICDIEKYKMLEICSQEPEDITITPTLTVYDITQDFSDPTKACDTQTAPRYCYSPTYLWQKSDLKGRYQYVSNFIPFYEILGAIYYIDFKYTMDSSSKNDINITTEARKYVNDNREMYVFS